jgi:hypothetical protein
MSCWAQAQILGQAPTSSQLTSEYAKGRIFLVKAASTKVQEYLNMFPPEHVLEAVEHLRKRGAATYHASDTSHHTVVYVFTGVAPVGAKVKTRTHMLVRHGGPPESHEYTLTVPPSATNPAIVLNETHVNHGGFMDCRLLVDDTEVTRVRFDVR